MTNEDQQDRIVELENALAASLRREAELLDLLAICQTGLGGVQLAYILTDNELANIRARLPKDN